MNESFQIEKIYDIARDKLFNIFQDTAKIERWSFFEERGKAKVENTFKEGGPLLVTTALQNGQEFSWKGVYRKIESNSLIEYSWSDDDVEDSLVKIKFVTVGENKTRVELNHSNFPDVKTMLEHKAIWLGCMENLEQYVDNPAGILEEIKDYDDSGAYY